MTKGRAQENVGVELNIPFDQPQKDNKELPFKRGGRRENETVCVYRSPSCTWCYADHS